MRWMKCWARNARQGSLRGGISFFVLNLLVLMLLSSIALPQETTLRSQSNVVLIPALVKDRQGGIVYGLHSYLRYLQASDPLRTPPGGGISKINHP